MKSGDDIVRNKTNFLTAHENLTTWVVVVRASNNPHYIARPYA
jgi:hypothetical protein